MPVVLVSYPYPDISLIRLMSEVVLTRVNSFVEFQFSKDSTYPSTWSRSHPKLQLWTFYGLSSFSYSILGILMLTAFRGNYARAPQIGIPQSAHAAALICQSVATLNADVFNLTRDSMWHALDRWVAFSNVVFLASNLFWVSWFEIAIFSVGLVGGYELLNRSRLARLPTSGDAHTEEGFAFWHGAWHWGYPTLVAGWLCFRQFT